MTLMNQIKNDQIQARKNRETDKASLLTTLIGEASMIGKNANRETTDDEVMAVVRKFIKNANEFISLSKDEAKVATLQTEVATLSVYLPQQMTESELADALRESGVASNKGLMMKFLKEHFAGKYDGPTAAKVVDSVISNG